MYRNNELYKAFASWKQTYKQLAEDYDLSITQVQACLDKYHLKKRKLHQRNELYY